MYRILCNSKTRYMEFNTIIFNISIEFINAWNNGDFISVSNHLSETIVFESPLISPLKPEYINNRIEGKEEVLNYLKVAFLRKPSIIIDINSIQFKKDSDLIYINTLIENTDIILEATYKLNEYGKFTILKLNYPNYPKL